MALSEGIAVAPYSPLAGGLLTGKYLRGESGRFTEKAGYGDRYAQDWMSGALAGLVALAGEVGTDPATLAVAWVAHHPAVTAPIISARSAAQLAPSLAAAEFRMDDGLFARITALVPDLPSATDRPGEN